MRAKYSVLCTRTGIQPQWAIRDFKVPHDAVPPFVSRRLDKNIIIIIIIIIWALPSFESFGLFQTHLESQASLFGH